MPGWDDFVISDYVRKTFDAPVVVDNDVNAMALGEYVDEIGATPACFHQDRDGYRLRNHVPGGELHRGVNGAAGDIGHIGFPTTMTRYVPVATWAASKRSLPGPRSLAGLPARVVTSKPLSEVVRLAQAGDPDVMLPRIRRAGEQIGSVIASLVNFYNPETIIIGGLAG